jgi:SAM-dependent methyltransferase
MAYDKEYFDYHKNIGAFGGWANLFKFEEYIHEKDRVIDFGSGGGYLLHHIHCKEKIGIEINPVARETSLRNSIPVVESIDQVEDNWADVIISNHALEHTERPLDELKALFKKLKRQGKIIFVVPIERVNHYRPNEINQHLYTWSEMNLGNLFTKAGFTVKEVKEIKHRWPPNFVRIRKIAGSRGFHLICQLYGKLHPEISQIRCVAIRP